MKFQDSVALFASFFFSLLFLYPPLFAQQDWGSSYLHEQLYATDNAYRTRTDSIEQVLYRQALTPATGAREILSVPIVVHIVHLPDDRTPVVGSSNPSDQQIADGLRLLNEAFRKQGTFTSGPHYSNAGIEGADVEIEFCLAAFDPAGNASTGITRTSSTLSTLFRDASCNGGTQDACLKASNFWDANQYLNVWLVSEICRFSPNTGCELRGYTFPAAAHGTDFDGIVLEAGDWSNDPSKITHVVHEFGHYFNLFDTYQDPPGPKISCDNGNCLIDGDRVCDTPPDQGPDTLSCGARINSCASDSLDDSANNPFRRDVEDLYENFMDGGNPACRNSFTPGQKIRMRNALTTIRNSLLNNSFCSSPTILDAALSSLSSPQALWCESPPQFSYTLSNPGTEALTTLGIESKIDGQRWTLVPWKGNLAPGDSLTLDFVNTGSSFPAGTHAFSLQIVEINGDTLDTRPDNQIDSLVFSFVPSQTTIDTFPYCFNPTEDLDRTWTQLNLDRILGFDAQAVTNCEIASSTALRYNSSGAWDNGNGISASSTGTVDILRSPPIELPDSVEAWLSFGLAFKESLPSKDVSLRIGVAPDCDGSFDYVYDLDMEALNTAADPFNPTIIGWEPQACRDWRQDSISLAAVAGQRFYLSIELDLAADFTQNLYLSDLCISWTQIQGPDTLLPEPIDSVAIFPNPASAQAFVSVPFDEAGEIQLSLYDVNWQEVYRTQWVHDPSAGIQRLNTQELTPSIYFYVLRYRAQAFRGTLVITP